MLMKYQKWELYFMAIALFVLGLTGAKYLIYFYQLSKFN